MPYSGDGSNMYGLRAEQLYEIQAAFHEMDANHNGYLSIGEIRQCLLRNNVRFNDSEIHRVLAQMDYNHDGRVSYDEYMYFMAQIYRGEF